MQCFDFFKKTCFWAIGWTFFFFFGLLKTWLVRYQVPRPSNICSIGPTKYGWWWSGWSANLCLVLCRILKGLCMMIEQSIGRTCGWLLAGLKVELVGYPWPSDRLMIDLSVRSMILASLGAGDRSIRWCWHSFFRLGVAFHLLCPTRSWVSNSLVASPYSGQPPVLCQKNTAHAV